MEIRKARVVAEVAVDTLVGDRLVGDKLELDKPELGLLVVSILEVLCGVGKRDHNSN